MNTLKRTRLLKEVSQGKLAANTGLSRQVISNLERGASRGYPETWQRIAKALDVTVDELLEVPKADARSERWVEPPAGGIEDPGPDVLTVIIRRLSDWGRETAANKVHSDMLQRDLKVIDDVFDEAFRAYRAWEARGEETGELARAVEALVSSSVALKEAKREAEAREADPEWKAEISEFPERRRSDKPKGPQQAEAG